MNIQVVATFQQIQNFQTQNPTFSLEAYRKYANEVSPSLYTKCLEDSSEYNFEAEVLPVLNSALYQNFERIEKAHQALQQIADFLPERVTKYFQGDLQVTILFYLGLCNGAGWATTLDKKPAILLGAEKIAELQWHNQDSMADLTCHELAHLIHYTFQSELLNLAKSIQQLYFEGFATRVAHKFYREGFYSQDQNGWLTFCQKNFALIRQIYLEKLRNQESTSCFFGDWNSLMGHSNLGYYLGCQWIRFMERKYSIQQIASLPGQTIEKEAYLFLELPES